VRTPFNRPVADILAEDWERRRSTTLMRAEVAGQRGGRRIGAGAKPKTVSPDMLARMKRLREGGCTWAQIAEVACVHWTTAKALVGGPADKRVRQTKWQREARERQRAQVYARSLALVREGWTWTDVAREVGTTPHGLSHLWSRSVTKHVPPEVEAARLAHVEAYYRRRNEARKEARRAREVAS